MGKSRSLANAVRRLLRTLDEDIFYDSSFDGAEESSATRNLKKMREAKQEVRRILLRMPRRRTDDVRDMRKEV